MEDSAVISQFEFPEKCFAKKVLNCFIIRFLLVLNNIFLHEMFPLIYNSITTLRWRYCDSLLYQPIGIQLRWRFLFLSTSYSSEFLSIFLYSISVPRNVIAIPPALARSLSLSHLNQSVHRFIADCSPPLSRCLI